MKDLGVMDVLEDIMVKRMLTKLVMKDVTPHKMALGVAFGTLVALLPTFGFGSVIAFGLLPFMPNMSRTAIFIALAFWNPLVQIPIYALSLELSSVFYTGDTIEIFSSALLNEIHTFTLKFLLGHLIITLFFTILSYGLVYTARKLTMKRPYTEIVFTDV